MDIIGKYKIEKFPPERRFIIDGLTAGANKHVIYGLLEFDVTAGRQQIRELRRRTGRKVSFLAWYVKCVSQAVSEHPEVQIYRHGNRKMVTFEDVDVVVVVERLNGARSINFPTIIRRANNKNIPQITTEIEGVKTEQLRESTVVLGEKRTMLEWVARWAPTLARRLWWLKMKSNAFLTKKTMGTVSVTALGMFGKSSGYIIPNAIHNLGFGLGSLTRKPGLVGGRIEIRQYLNVTLYANHETVDGAPLARFIARLTELAEGAWGLD